MVRFATVDDYGWIYELLEDLFPNAHKYFQEELAEQIKQKHVIVETDEHSVAAFTPCDDYTDVKFNITNPAYSNVLTSSSVLSTYLLYKYRVPIRFCLAKTLVENYFATKNAYVRDHHTLVGEKQFAGAVCNWYEYEPDGL